MTLPKVVRVFFAIDLPEATKKNISKFIGQLKQKSKPRSILWTKPENLHITLQFLAEVKAEHLAELIENVRSEVGNLSQGLSFAFANIEVFPNARRPRVIVLDISPQDEVAKLAEAIARGITKTNYPTETRPFHGHLTLGRIRNPRGLDLQFLSQTSFPEIEKVILTEVVLFRSETHPEGSVYTVLEKIAW